MRIKVYEELSFRIPGKRTLAADWMMECEEHDEQVTSDCWAAAYEAAVGHAAMYHPVMEPCS